jgi:hypothetical protein
MGQHLLTLNDIFGNSNQGLGERGGGGGGGGGGSTPLLTIFQLCREG